MILLPTNRRIIRPHDKPSFEHTQRYGLIKGHWANTNRVGLWLFNEGSDGQVLDLSGNGNIGTFVGDVFWTSGKLGSALSFPGSSDYLNCGTNPSVLPAAWTVVAYCKTNDVENCWLSTAGAFNSMGCVLQYITGGRPLLYLGLDNWQYFVAAGWNTIKDGNYHQIVFNCPGNSQTDIDNAAMYVDAESIAKDGAPTKTGAQAAKTNLLIGADDTSPTRHYSGNMDYFYLYNRALSASEIAQLYREPFLGIEKRTAPVYFFVPTGVDVTVEPSTLELALMQPAPVVSIDCTVTPGAFALGLALLAPVVIGDAADWIGISSAHYHSHCGDDGVHTVEEALDGTDYWKHYITETHHVVVDLIQIYQIQKVRGRSHTSLDPTSVNIYFNNTGEAPWGDAVASNITTWQDIKEWVEIAAVGEGRFVKVEVADTEDENDYLTFGENIEPFFSIFDVYGEIAPTKVEPNTLALAATLHPPTIVVDCTVTPATLELAAALLAPEVWTGVVVTPDTFALALTQHAPVVSVEVIVFPAVFELEATLHAPEVISHYTAIPSFMQKDLIDPYSGGAWLWLCEIAVPGYGTQNIARNTEDIRHAGKDYNKWNLDIGKQTFAGDGSIPRVTLRIAQDPARTFEKIVNASKGCHDGTVKLIRVNEKFLDYQVTALEADYNILVADSDWEWVYFTLGIPNLLTQRIPLRVGSSKICPWAVPEYFKGVRCRYTGSDVSCTGKLNDCYDKGNAQHWGGEVGLDPNVTRV